MLTRCPGADIEIVVASRRWLSSPQTGGCLRSPAFRTLAARLAAVLTVTVFAVPTSDLQASEVGTGNLPTLPGSTRLTADGSMVAQMLATALTPTAVACSTVSPVPDVSPDLADDAAVSDDATAGRDMCFDFGVAVYRMCKPYGGMLVCAKLATDLFILCEAWELLT